ncbi:hypothetical protein BLNAU_3977 [Blattamonas nauphoetae]|uniref:Uncharacterized protein n=1 Tax=Blattamonas nauphoetae TaxID=2049346 RepID=A0ABQ9YBV9_9EUKA|nr:hypothetical protein BLNAU_3977 [Blattamonas nauphoetae]
MEWELKVCEERLVRELLLVGINVTFSSLAIHSLPLVHHPHCSHLRLLICHSRNVPADRLDDMLIDDSHRLVEIVMLKMEDK